MNDDKLFHVANGYAAAYCEDHHCLEMFFQVSKGAQPIIKKTIEVYLGISWHDVNEMPDDHDDIIVRCKNGETYISKFTSHTEWITELVRNKAVIWAYVGDILPARRNGNWFVNIKE